MKPPVVDKKRRKQTRNYHAPLVKSRFKIISAGGSVRPLRGDARYGK
jgi:hypothetical protein